MQIIEIPLQDLGINTEVDDDQNQGWVRQERAYFRNGRVEKIRGLSSVVDTDIDMDPDIVKFWKYDNSEYWLIFDESSGALYRFDKNLNNPVLLYTATTDETRVDIEGSRAVIYSLGQSPLTSLIIDRKMYHDIVGGGNYPKYNDTFLDWNRVRVFDDIDSPSAGDKLFKIKSSIGSNAQLIKNPGEDYLFDRLGRQADQIVPFGRPAAYPWTSYVMFMYPQRRGNLEFATDGSKVYYYRYSLIFDGQQESELSETILNTSGVDFTTANWDNGDEIIDNYAFNSMFQGKFKIDIGNPNVSGSFYPGNPRVTGVNIYRSTDPNGTSHPFKKIITTSSLGAKADLISQTSSECTMGAGNFLYDNCDFSQIGITTDDYVYQAGIGNISEVEPDNSKGKSQKGLLKFSASTLGGGRGCHPEMTGEPWKDISCNYVIVNRDLNQALDEHGTYWCGDQDGLKDAGGSNDTWFRTTTSGSSAAQLYRASNNTTIAGGDDRNAIRDFHSTSASDYGRTGSVNRQQHDNVTLLNPLGGDRFIHASFNSNAPASLAASTEYYWECYFRLPTCADNPNEETGQTIGNFTHLVAYEGASAPTSHSLSLSTSNATHLGSYGHELEAWNQPGYDMPPSSNYCDPHQSGPNRASRVSRRFIKASGFYTTASGTPKFTLIAYTSSSQDPFAAYETSKGSRGRVSIFEFLITKSAYVKRKSHNGASTGCYSDDFVVADDNTLENNFYTIYDSSRGYPTTDDNNGWIVGNYGKCVLPWNWKEETFYDFGDTFASSSNYSFHRALNSVLLLNSRVPTHDGDGSIIISPNYRWIYNKEESGGLDTTTNNIIIDYDFIDNGITDGADHPGTLTLSTDVRYKYSTNHIGRRFVGNVILNGDREDSETLEDFIMYSDVNSPDVIPIANFIKLNDLDGGAITGLAKSLGDIVALMERGIFILSIPSTDITQWTLTETYKDVGCTSPKSVTEYNNGVFFANEDNFYYLDSGRRLIGLADPWLNDYQNLFSAGGIAQVVINPTKSELILVFNNSILKTTYALNLTGFEENPRWHKDIQYGSKSLVIDNLKNMYSFKELPDGFERSLVLHSLDRKNADVYPNNIPLDLVLESPYQKLTDLDTNVIIRKLNLRYNSVDEIYVDIYTDGDDSAYKKRVVIPPSSTNLTYDDGKDYTHESNIKVRANRIKCKISTPSTTNTLTSIRRLELEID